MFRRLRDWLEDRTGIESAVQCFLYEEIPASSGWHQVTRIKDESDWVSVLTHVTGDQIDGLVALIFESEDKEITFVNLVGPIDLSKLGDYGDTFHVPGLDQAVPGAH